MKIKNMKYEIQLSKLASISFGCSLKELCRKVYQNSNKTATNLNYTQK